MVLEKNHLTCQKGFLEEIDKDYMEIILQNLAKFIGWLRNPHSSHKVTPFKEMKSKKTFICPPPIAKIYNYIILFKQNL